MINVDLITTPYSWVLVLIGIAIFASRQIRRNQKLKSSPHAFRYSAKPQPEFSEDTYYQIEPLPNLDITTEEPIKIRPFKPKYYLTMAIENTTMSDLVAMDKTYAERIAIRKQLIRDEEHDVLATNPIVIPAVLEFHEWIMSTYLPQRCPTVFTLEEGGLRNLVTNELLPLQTEDATEAFRNIGANIDTDFLFLLPSLEEPEEVKYKLEGFITCFPSGFTTRQKLNLKLADIHGPVPGYSAKLEKSMDRFFSTLPAGKIVKRHNWSITTNRDLFKLSGNHLSEEEVAAGKGGEEDVDLGQTVLRCERQTLHRLPKSGAIVFGYKTYQYELGEIREEGNGEALASAIDGFGKGSVPGMAVYKKQVVWGEKVKAFLRGEVNGAKVGLARD